MDEIESNPRNRELTAVSEDQLLAQQEEFLSQNRRPSATVTRVTRHQPNAPVRTEAAATTSSSETPNIGRGRSSLRWDAAGGAGTQHRVRPVGAGDGPAGGGIRGEDPRLISTEDDLLRMQEEFLAQHSRPSARVTRIAPKCAAASTAAATASAQPSQDGAASSASAVGDVTERALERPQAAAAIPISAPAATTGSPPPQRTAAAVKAGGGVGPAAQPTAKLGRGVAGQGRPAAAGRGADEAPKEEPKSILGPIEGLLGDIVERCPAPPLEPTRGAEGVSGTEPAAAGPAAAAAAAALPFPEATHRRQSKFALSRKGRQQPGAVASSSLLAPGSGPSPGATTGATPPAAPNSESTLSNWSVLPSGPGAAGVEEGYPGDHRRGDASTSVAAPQDDLGRISAQNAEAVSQMRPEAVAAALDELSTRMSPESLEFLRRRGAQRLQQQQQQWRGAPDAPGGAGSSLGAGEVGRGARTSGDGEGAGGEAGGGPASLPGVPRGARPRQVRFHLATEVAAPARQSGRAGWAAGGLRGPEPDMASCSTQEDSNAVMDAALRALTGGEGADGGDAAAAAGRRLPASVAAPGHLVGSMPVGALAAAQQRSAAQQRHRQHPQGAGETAAQARTGAGAVTRGSPADPRLVARLRFDVDGAVVDVQGAEETFVEEEVLLRDNLRRDEGSAPPGYTLGELLVLCRSAVATQRVAGLLTIADLAALARPRAEDIALYPRGAAAGDEGPGVAESPPGRLRRRFVPIPKHLRERAPACSVAWQEVWQFFVSELGLVAHLRLALDDDRPLVVAAAATALAAVLGRSESELLAAEMADLCPGTGWPAPPGGYLSRPGITAPWEAQPVAQPSPPGLGPGPSASGASGAAGGRGGSGKGAPGDDDPDPPEDVALVDPVAGALQMGLLQRARYLLASRHAPGAVLPMLAVLWAVTRSGSAAALAVAKEPGLLPAVGALLDPAAAVAVAAEGEQAESGGTGAVATASGAAADGVGGGSNAAGGAELQGGSAAATWQPGMPAAGAGAAGEAAAAGPGAAVGPEREGAAAVQVAALMLVRLLCCASAVVAQLVRSAGLLAHIQAYILLAAPSGAAATPPAGAGASAANAKPPRPQRSEPALSLSLQLLRLESLRTWRACAHHGMALASLDDLYGSLCHLLLPPVDSPPPGAVAASAAVRQTTAAEVYLLLGSLVRHSVAVTSGDATIGRSMLSPGAAAVIAAEALAWLGPVALRGVTAVAIARCNLTVPLLSGSALDEAAVAGSNPNSSVKPDPSGGVLRVLVGAHPAVLLPPAAAYVACLAAVTSFLATYWSTVPAAQPVFGAVRQALQASGLLQIRPAAASVAGLPGLSPGDALAMQLLRRTVAAEEGSEGAGGVAVGLKGAQGGGPEQRARREAGEAAEEGRQMAAEGEAEGRGDNGVRSDDTRSAMGQALAAWAIAVVANEPVAPAAVAAATAAAARARGNEGLRLGALAQACMQVAAGALLHGTLLLSSAVLHEDHAATATPLAAALVVAAAPLCCHAAAALPAAVGRVLCPWHGAAMQRHLHLTRQLHLAGSLLPPSVYLSPPVFGGADESPAPSPTDPASGSQMDVIADKQQQQGEVWLKDPDVSMWLLEGCLSALSTAPPGAEGLCLQALRLGLRGSLLEQPLRAGHSAATQLPTHAVNLALAAAGVPYTTAVVDAAAITAVCSGRGTAAAAAAAPFPLPAAPPDAAAAAETLFESYAASWLSLISQRRLAGGGGGAGAGSGAPPPPAVPRVNPLELTPVSLQGQAGSRLPAPSQWAMLEAHRLPQRRQQAQEAQQPEDEAREQARASALHPVGCALMLCLGREASSTGRSSGSGSRGVAGSGAVRGALRWLPEGTKMQAALQAAYLFRAAEMVPQDADEASEGSWRDPLVRWGLAGLARRYLWDSTAGAQPWPPGPPGLDWLPTVLAEKLISSLVSTCFGDPLLAAHLALALAPGGSPVVRLQVWNGLAMEKSLHLLPPLARCLGSPQHYLSVSAPSAGSPAPPTGPVVTNQPDSKPEPEPDPAFLAAVQRSLVEGDLDKALQAALPMVQELGREGPGAPAAGITPDSSPDSDGSPEGSPPGAGARSVGCSSSCVAVSGDVALHLLASNLLRRDRWPAVARAWRRTSSADMQAGKSDAPGREGSGTDVAATTGEAPGVGGSSLDRGDLGPVSSSTAAAAMLSGLVRSAAPELVAKVLVCAEERCGVRRKEAGAVLVQTCSGGEPALMERARRVLALCDLA